MKQASTTVTVFLFFSALLAGSCTKLNETFPGDLTQGQIAGNASSDSVLLLGIYNSMEAPFTSAFEIFLLAELPTDEAILPTRGADWGDNGIHRVLHEQKWDADNPHINDCFNDLGGIVYAATDILQYHPTVSQQAQARFIRAWAMYWILSFYNQVPYRDPGEGVVQPARVRKGIDALNYIISEITAVENDLPDGPAYLANKYAAKAFLMKCYLNKAIFTDRTNPSPAFDAADMNTVISLADSIIKSNRFSFTQNYFDNFAPDNTDHGTENIFTLLNIGSITNNNNLASLCFWDLHYAQGGINGGATLPEFYNKFEPADLRRGTNYPTPGSPPNPGNHVNVGFLAGQQYDLESNTPLYYSASGFLIYTPEVHNIETGADLAVTGIRPKKYSNDYNNLYSPDNDYVFLRLADVLLMKAEAILRGGTATNEGTYGTLPVEIVNSIRTHPSRGASALASITLNGLLDERGRELWWEDWRREDMIRFNTFLNPFGEKDYQSDPRYLIFPIPSAQLAVNSINLKQNPGY